MRPLHARLSDVPDAEFQQMIDELHHCVNWARDDHAVTSLFYLLSAIAVEDPKALAANRLPTGGILLTKVNKLPTGAVHDVCVELSSMKGAHIESFDGKNVLSLLKICFPKAARPRKSSHN